MIFTIDRTEENGFSVIRLTDHFNKSTVAVLPQHGAMLHEFTTTINGVSHNHIDNYPNAEALKAQIGISYKGTKLSPFPCRIKQGKYAFKGSEYEFANKFPDGSAIHGLLYNRPFELTDNFVTESNASITLYHEYGGDDPGYPFRYSCSITYTFNRNNKLSVETVVKNLDDETIPVADGWHPYFQLGGKADDWTLKFCSSKILDFTDQLVPSGSILKDDRFVSPKLLGDTSLDNCFLLDRTDDQPVCELANPSNNRWIRFYADEQYPYLQIYTPPSRNSIAIENLSAAPDSFNNRMGLVTLKPGETITFKLHYITGEK
jgi:aldose 1-epimerase